MVNQEQGQRPEMLVAIRDGERLAEEREAGFHTHEVAVAIYMDGAAPGEPGIAQFSRPQDFATRKAWRYFKFRLLFPVSQGAAVNYLVHGYIDVEISEGEFVKRVSRMAQHMGGLPIFHDPAPMAPSDGLQEDDFWDHDLGEPTWWDDREEYD